MIRRNRDGAILILTLLCISCFLAYAQDDPDRLLHKQRLEGIDLSPDWRGVVVDWTAMDEQGWSRLGIPWEKEFQVVKLSEFEKAQQVVERLAGDYGHLELLHGTPCFVPADDSESNLSVPVTLDLENVSTWQALKAVVRLVNCHRRFGVGTHLSASTKGALDVPEEFDQVSTISIKVDNVPAREAICMILAQAPLSIGVHSTNQYRPDVAGNKEAPKWWFISFHFYRGNQPIVATEFYSRERGSFWASERKEAMEPAEGCADVAKDKVPDQQVDGGSPNI
jgi:hypothetical protein